jgi:hypothetical protein
MTKSFENLLSKEDSMKKLLVLFMVLGIASISNAAVVTMLGDASGTYSGGSKTVTVTYPVDYTLYVWGSSDLAIESDSDGNPLPETGLDNIQMFLQYDTTKVNLKGGLLSNYSAVSGNPWGTTIAGKGQGTYGGLGYVEGAMLSTSGVDAYSLQKIFKIVLTATQGGSASLKANVSGTHQSKQGNSVAGTDYWATEGSITFVPEPMTIGLLGLGALFLRRRR